MSKNKISASQEDYLEAIYKIIQEKQSVKAIEISKHLGVGRSSVTEALQNLAAKNLVNYNKYDAISLTPKGEEKAKEVALKHQILYDFLTQILDIAPEEAHKNACKIEHVISDEVFKKFIMYIEFNKSINEKYFEEFKNFCKKNNYEKKEKIMPNLNGAGPMGLGAGTGRRMGTCNAACTQQAPNTKKNPKDQNNRQIAENPQAYCPVRQNQNRRFDVNI